MSCFADWSKRCHVTFVIIECWMCHGHLTAMLNRDVTMHHCNWWPLTCGLLQLLLLHYTLLTALCPGLLGSAGTRKVKPIWILLKQETVSGSGISWAICTLSFYRPDALPAAQPTASKHWRHNAVYYNSTYNQKGHCVKFTNVKDSSHRNKYLWGKLK